MAGPSFFPSSPRRRRLESDHRRLESLAGESSIFSFQVVHPRPTVGPPETYRVRFRGIGLQSLPGPADGNVVPIHDHEILIQLVAEYPRSAPHMRWMTPIFHPNISASGAICLGGWGTHWAPSLQLDRLCEMLWDMMRFANYDTRSPFNQQAATWLRSQRQFRFPLDERELRDRPQFVEAVMIHPAAEQASPDHHHSIPEVHFSKPADAAPSQPPNSSPDILFLD